MKHEIADAVGGAALKISVPVGVVAASQAGWGVQEWMYAATLVYVLLQAAQLVWKWVSDWRKPKP